MFDSAFQFFPTPSGLASKMVAPYSDRIKKGATVGDYSAGKGDLLDAAKYMMPFRKSCYAIEIQTDLQAILKSKGHKVIGSDFFEWRGGYGIDVVLMNPTFSNGDDHLIRAWGHAQIQSGQVDIACLLNAETIRNPHTASRKELAGIIEKFGSVEFVGQAFKTSERKTDVEVALVRLTKPARSKAGFAFSVSDFQTRVGESIKGAIKENSIAKSTGELDALVDVMARVEVVASKYAQARYEFCTIAKYLFGSGSAAYTLEAIEKNHHFDTNESVSAFQNDVIDESKRRAWQMVIDKSELRKFATSTLREKVDKFIEEQVGLEFSIKNIDEMISHVFASRNALASENLIAVFDRLTADSMDEKNKTWLNTGWKSNKYFFVSQKLVLPYVVNMCRIMQKMEYRQYGRGDLLSDLEQAMLFVTGEKCSLVSSIRNAFDERPQRLKGECEHFEWTAYKKGTLHLKFKDEKIWQRFNIRCAEAKGWPLPPSKKDI
jgi:hypothetical protein